MSEGLIGKKLGMLQVFTEEEKAIPCTVVLAGPCIITQIKTKEKEGYDSIQMGFESQKIQRQILPVLLHIQKALGNDKDKTLAERKKKSTQKNIKSLKILKEFRIIDPGKFEIGQTLKVDLFSPEESVEISGISKGKGFQGVMKRHNFHGGPKSHGAHKWHRRGGSIGMCATPGRVVKGTKMPGRMGNDKVTIRGVKVVKVIPEQNLILLKGPLPGSINSYVLIRKQK